MIKNKFSRILISMMLTVMIITIVGQTSVFAANTTVSAILSKTRWTKNSSNAYTNTGNAYALNSGDSHPLFQILSVDSTDKTIGTNYYCLNALKGDTWMNSNDGSKVVYDRSYDLVSQKNDISNASDLVATYKNVINTNYGKIMWVLDNMYKEGGLTIQEVLANAGIVKGDTGITDARLDNTINTYYYDPTVRSSSKMSTDIYSNENFWGNINKGRAYYYVDNGAVKDVLLSKELVEAIQQAVIWYFTNNSQYDCYTTSYSNIDWLKYSTNVNQSTIDWQSLGSQTITNSYNETIHTGTMLQEQAAILYNYLVEGANAAGNNYVGTSVGTIDIEYTGASTDSKITEKDSNYIIGPLKITTTGSTTLKGIEVKVGNNTITSQVTDANGASKTLKANENFYVKVAKSDVTGTVKITAKAEYTATDKKLWVKVENVNQDDKAEQPLVEVEGRKDNIEDSIEIPLNKQFDLALRKTIVKIVDKNGTTKSIINEDGRDATRNITVDPSTIPETAKYKHRKDPVVITTEDVVTYRITIYNEGEIDGYASKIVDQLPKGLESVLALNGTVTSHNGNVYKVTSYDTTTNKLELTIDTAMASRTSIGAFNGTTVKNDYIELNCKVTGTPKEDGTTKQYLTNIAYIAEEYDKDGNQITADRDGNESKPTNSPNKTAEELNNSNANNYKGDSSNKSVYSDTNNTEYYKGQEDDDDFEKLVILPKHFDLALRKFITKINDKNITDRVPDITSSEVEKLINGNASFDNGTTASKKHSKDKLKVKIGDTVIYTIRIYNEGDIDGYASEVTDYLPEGLSLKENSTINETYGWTSGTENAIKTTYLADKLISAMSSTSTNIEYRDLQVECIVNDKATSNNLKNIAEITEDKDKDGNDVEDTDSTPDNVNEDDYKPTNPEDGRGEQDDDDFEDLGLAKFDLALRKFITKISEDGNFNTVTEINPSREPQVDSSKLKAGTADTAIYNHSKEPIVLTAGDYVLYTIRAYNEGDIDGYASQIIDYLPENLDFVESTDSFIKSINDKWTYDSATRKVTTKTEAANTSTKLSAFDAQNDDGKGSGLDYVDVQIVCKVNKKAPSNKKLTNIAEISEYKDEDGEVVEKDRDSSSNNLKYPENPETYKDNEINKDYVPGQEDDDDFEKVIVKERIVDLALTKFITAVSADTKIEDGEYLTPNKKIGSKTNEYIRATVADTTGLKAGTSTNATYTPKKDIEPLVVGKNSYVLYNIRVYNEGEVDVYAGEIADYLPENLEFVDGEFNKQYGWTANGQTVKTRYYGFPAEGVGPQAENALLKAFDKENDDGKGSGLDYKDLPILCKVSDKAESGKKMVNTAEITKYEDEDGNELPKDIDSTPENKEEKNVEERDEDDDDYEVVIIKDFDLALRKFITTIGGKDISTRIPQLSYENEKITYTHPKDVLRTTVGDTVTYTLRVFNEGDIAGFAEEITDDIPEHLEFLPENAINREFKWVMYDKEGKSTTKVSDAVKIKTDYTSKANGELLMKDNSKLTENPNLLKAFDKKAGITDKNPDYVDVKVAFKVKDPKSNKTVIVNKAQISEDADENGNPVDDIDSIPDKWNDGEDDQDYENVAVDYFDLSLLKYVTKTIVTENGKTKTTKTGNNGSSKDITPKVEVYRKSVNKVIVKFEYTIKITNEGDIAGYAREITDYVPKGLKFYKEDNKGWKDEGNNVISTELLKNTLLKPGQSATVKVILRWVNGENNLGIKTNVAEISKDYNEKGVPDRDSTPDNKKKGEDDIDDAPVLLTISTGILEHTIQYVVGALVVLVVLGSGLVVIKKYVL